MNIQNNCIYYIDENENGDSEMFKIEADGKGKKADRRRAGEKTDYGHGYYPWSGNFCAQGGAARRSGGGDRARI